VSAGLPGPTWNCPETNSSIVALRLIKAVLEPTCGRRAHSASQWVGDISTLLASEAECYDAPRA
jgi:hypothetical protein